MCEKYTSVLQIPLYKLLYVEEIKEEPLTKKELERFYLDYESHEIEQIVESLRWAYNNPDYPFSSLVPGITFSNQQAYSYLVNLLQQIDRVRPESSAGFQREG